MRMAFISDIHGNAIALEAVLQDIRKKKLDKVYVLGDICYRGPEPKRSLELVRSLNTEVIKGNADEWVVRGVQEGEVAPKALDLMNTEREWTVGQLEQTDITYLKNLPAQLNWNWNGIEIACFHATPPSLFTVVPPNASDKELEKQFFQAVDAQVYIYAHIHKPYIRYLNGKVVMNIGSVGLPFDGLAKASYGIVEIKDGSVSTSIERVRFNTEKVIELYREVHYPNAEMMIDVIRNARL